MADSGNGKRRREKRKAGDAQMPCGGQWPAMSQALRRAAAARHQPHLGPELHRARVRMAGAQQGDAGQAGTSAATERAVQRCACAEAGAEQAAGTHRLAEGLPDQHTVRECDSCIA